LQNYHNSSPTSGLEADGGPGGQIAAGSGELGLRQGAHGVEEVRGTTWGCSPAADADGVGRNPRRSDRRCWRTTRADTGGGAAVGVPARGPMERLPLGVPELLEDSASLVGVLERRIARRPAMLGQPVAARCSGRRRRCAVRRRRREAGNRASRGRASGFYRAWSPRARGACAQGEAAAAPCHGRPHSDGPRAGLWPGRSGLGRAHGLGPIR
jgi:hypothetical protein